MIQLTCPKCAKQLQLDDTFRGGVCRCYACSTMLTVPEEDEQIESIPEELFLHEEKDAHAGSLGRTTIFKTRAGLQLELTDDDIRAMPVAHHHQVAIDAQGSASGAWLALGAFALLLIIGIGSAISRSGREAAEPKVARIPDRPAQPGDSPTLEQVRKALPDADETFVIGQMNKGYSISQIRDQWAYEKKRRAALPPEETTTPEPAIPDEPKTEPKPHRDPKPKPTPKPTLEPDAPQPKPEPKPPVQPAPVITLAPVTVPQTWQSRVGLILDSSQAKPTGSWHRTPWPGAVSGNTLLTDAHTEKIASTLPFRFFVPRNGRYEVRVAYAAGPTHAATVPVNIRHADGEERLSFDQQIQPNIDGRLISLGRFRFDARQPAEISISNTGTDGLVTFNALQLVSEELLAPTPRADGMIANWRFEGDLADSVGGHHAHSKKRVEYEPGVIGEGASFTPKKGRITVPYHPQLAPEKLTLAMWIRLESHFEPDASPAHDPTLLIGTTEPGALAGYELLLDGGEMIFRITHLDGTTSEVRAPIPVSDTTTWFHLAATRDEQYLRLYVDGQEITASPTQNPTLLHHEAPLKIGDRFAGALDDLRIYARAWGSEAIGRMAGITAVATARAVTVDPITPVAPMPVIPTTPPPTTPEQVAGGQPLALDPADLRRRLIPIWAADARRSLTELGVLPDLPPADAPPPILNDAVRAEALRLMGTRLDRDSAIDAVVKIRLLPLIPDSKTLDPKMFLDVIDNLPRPTAPTPLTRSEREALEIARQTVVSESKLQLLVQRINDRVETQRRMGQSAAELRRRLITLLPEADERRVLIQLIDLRDRYAAADPATAGRGPESRAHTADMDQLIRDAEIAWLARTDYSSKMRARFADVIGSLQKMQALEAHRQRIIEASIDNRGLADFRILGTALNEERFNNLKKFLTTRRPE